ncbi:sugar ABC transporter permease [Clostridium thermosuccinogenes]|uniref:Sugar ABC transporter permease n=1 Tax=Clostridium thermosuccinogenes TaxID=84032 RepID=A0A2K2FN91_9CLOT|nr:carbohydrate ABC transporter permease [Pseudoclostridium thermosuccinogenes]AUS97961.1 sugar ABC transporter permease [Pseudoclostridium thermosuccinogenes]PNU00258.1 sugar ABC transporter permease [Pseudoclostridium thermosuccinogenes]PNU01582.1 sugar ABC transporter permease [Pseudoclostridium thermosuccinogenes]
MVTRYTFSERIFSIVNAIFLSLLALVCVYPLMYVVFASFSDPRLLMQHEGLLLLPKGFTLKGYDLVLKNPNIKVGFLNTVYYVIAGTAVSMLLTCFGAYALSRKRVFFAKYVLVFITITMFFSGGLIPFYLTVKNLGLFNTRWAIIIPSAISTWNLIVMRTSFMEIPESFEESAKIDGANDFTILFRIIIPLSKAIMAVMILFYSVGMWNSWFNASIFLSDRRYYPIQLILREILITNDKGDMLQVLNGITAQTEDLYRQLVQYTTIVIATVPVLFIYPFLQKYFVKGIMVGSLKG